MDIRRAEKDLEQAERELAEYDRHIKALEKKRSDCAERIDQLKTFLKVATKYALPQPASKPETSTHLTADTTLENPEKPRDLFYGKSLPQAACAFLLMQGRSMHLNEITQGLIRAGVSFGAKKPEQSVHFSLRRAESLGHVMRDNRAEWRIAPESLATGAVMKYIGAASSVDFSKHSEITKAGVDVAKSRGVRVGRPVVMTDDAIIKIVGYVRDEGLSIPAAAKKAGVSPQVIYKTFPGGVKSIIEKYPRTAILPDDPDKSVTVIGDKSVIPFKKPSGARD